MVFSPFAVVPVGDVLLVIHGFPLRALNWGKSRVLCYPYPTHRPNQWSVLTTHPKIDKEHNLVKVIKEQLRTRHADGH